METKTFLLFGANSSIGSYIHKKLKESKLNIITTSSKNTNKSHIYFNVNDSESYNNLKNLSKIDYILYCQGKKIYDNIIDFNYDDFKEIMDINLHFIIVSLNLLMNHNDLLNSNIVIISSLLQEFSNKNKLSYVVSKSAISGLIKSLSVDLKDKNILVNAILPGPVNTKMTNLNVDKKNKLIQNIGYNRMISLEDIYNTFSCLCFNNNSITGQSIKVDLGLSIEIKY